MLRKVFLVEDETVIREGLRDRIPWDQFGYRFVGEAADGEMALPLIRKTKPDVLITDIKMPFMDGLSLSKIVSKEFPRMKIIIISGYDDFEYARQAIEVGVDQYLLKPVTRMKLKNVLLELKDKISSESLSGMVSDSAGGYGHVSAAASDSLGEALEALMVLGYSQGETAPILRKLDPSLPTQDLIKETLRIMAAKNQR